MYSSLTLVVTGAIFCLLTIPADQQCNAFTFTPGRATTLHNPFYNKQKATHSKRKISHNLSMMVGAGDIPFFATIEPAPKEGTASITNRLPLGTIFDSRDYIFSTVTNVRTYEWTTKEAEELLDDLLDASNGSLVLAGADGEKNSSKKPDYELSQIVVVPMEWDKELYGLGNRYDVHDGQQRLVTLCLLFAALRDSFDQEGEGDMKDTVTELANMLNPPKVRKADVLRIELHKRDNIILSHILKDDSKALDHINIKKLTRANKCIYDNFNMLSTRMEAMEKEEKITFLDYLIEKVYILVCVPESSTIARSLVMGQGKGMDNEVIDDFKGLVCFRYTSDEKEMYKTFDRWDELAALSDIDNASVGRQTVSDACLLRATAELKVKIRKRDELYALERWLRKDIMEHHHDGNVFFQNKIEPSSLVLGQYREGMFNLFSFYSKSKGREELWKSITMRLSFLREMTTNIASTKEVEAIILELLLRANGSEKGDDAKKSMSLSDLDKYLHKTEQLALWAAVTKPTSTKKSQKLFAFLDAITEEKEDASKIESISQEDKSSLRESLVVSEFGLTASGKKFATFLLKRLNAFVRNQAQGSSAGADANTSSSSGDAYLEFILPQKATKKAWGDDWPDREEREQWVNKLGNLVLVSNKATTKEAKSAFGEKKERYNNEVYFPLTLEVAEMDKWDSDNLVKRLATIVGLIDQIWGL